MPDRPDDRTRMVIQPTSRNEKGEVCYSDVAMTALFNAHIANVASERQVIWHRYNVLLGANIAVSGFLGIGATQSKARALGGVIFGVVLCAIWMTLTIRGWNSFRAFIRSARTFKWYLEGTNMPEVNPMEMLSERVIRNRDVIYAMAIATIVAFLLAYTFLGILILIS